MNYREQALASLVVSGGRTVSAVDLATGEPRWTNADFGDSAGGAMIVTPERVYVAGWRQAGAIDARTGGTVWKAEIAADGRPALLREGDRLIVAGSGFVECLSIDGRILWRLAVPQGNSMTIAVDDRVASDDRER
ncbi:MAG: outer membrane protein assembly factor BamB family protein [Polyangiales bacterium]